MGRDLSTPEKRAAYNKRIREWRRKNPEKQKAIEQRWHIKQAAIAEQEMKQEKGGGQNDMPEVSERECEYPDCDGNQE